VSRTRSKVNGKGHAKKAVVIARDVAVRRLDEMIALIVENVEIGLGVQAVLESANAIVQADYKGGDSYTAHCYKAIQNCVALNLALTLARLFDPGARAFHPNKRDVASIPLMTRLLAQKRCRKVLAERAKRWTPNLSGMEQVHAETCEKQIEAALKSYAELRRTKEAQDAVGTLRRFRDKKLAHSLMNVMLDALPRYDQLFLLMNIARDVAGHAKLAIQGDSLDLADVEQERRRQADAFWRPALNAAFASN